MGYWKYSLALSTSLPRGERIAKTLTELKLPDIKVANNKLLIDVSVSMPAAIALDIILPHMSKSIFTEKLAANFGLAAFPLSIEHIIFPQPNLLRFRLVPDWYSTIEPFLAIMLHKHLPNSGRHFTVIFYQSIHERSGF